MRPATVMFVMALCGGRAHAGAFYSTGGTSYTADGDIYDPFVPPTSPSAFDDEFNDDTVTGWTEYEPSGGDLVTVSEDDGGLLLATTDDGAVSTSWQGVYKTAPATDQWEAVAHMCITGQSAPFPAAYLAVMEDATVSTGDLVGFMNQWTSAGANELGTFRYTDYTTFSTKTVDNSRSHCYWAAVQVDEVTPDTSYSVDTWYSKDGSSWIGPVGAVTGFPDANEVGLLADPTNLSNVEVRVRAFRVTRTGASGIYQTTPPVLGGRREYTTP